MQKSVTTVFIFALICFLALFLPASRPPSHAQNIFATNTPPPPTPIVITPSAPADFYALRIWLEPDLMTVLYDLLNRISVGDSSAISAFQFTQYELRYRFPGAPRNAADRARLLTSMLAAPRGAIDMRDMVHVVVEEALNQQPDQSEFSVNGFGVRLTRATVDNRGESDAVVAITYPAQATQSQELRYHEYVLAIRNANGTYRIVPAQNGYPFAPFLNTRDLQLERVEDINRDGQDELVVSVGDQSPNRRLFILGYRNDVILDLAQPNEAILYGQILTWPSADANSQLEVLRYQVESAKWNCLSELLVTWRYESNFYRPSTADNARYQNQNNLGCRLYEAEPLFALPPAEAIEIVEAALADSDPTDPSYSRARMTLAMLYTLNGQLEQALAIAQDVALTAEANSWAASQSAALQAALGISGNTTLDVCEALVIANEDGACDTRAVLTRIFQDRALTRDQDVLTQLESLGLGVLESTTIREVGRAERIAVSFDVFGAGWFAFAPIGPNNTYIVEAIEAPSGFGEAVFPSVLVEAPPAAFSALFNNNAPLAALAAIENAERSNPDVPLSAEARYLKALSYDLAGDRTRAKDAYYDIWTTFPNTVWGQLAGQHLERRE